MSIIAISGKIGSGKDTVGSIIQYLIWKSKIESGQATSIHTKLSDFLDNRPKSEWEIKKFAGKLKQIVSLITGIPTEALENINVKNSNLSEDWDYKVLSCGCDMVGLDPYIKDNECSNCGTPISVKSMFVREMLQKIGTNALRDQVHQNIHVNALFADYKLEHTIFLPPSYPNWIITDCRFPNELKAVKDKGGISIRINREVCSNCGEVINLHNNYDFSKPSKPLLGFLCNECGTSTSYTEQHLSETALDNAEFDYTIINNGTVEDLIESVKQILLKEKLL